MLPKHLAPLGAIALLLAAPAPVGGASSAAVGGTCPRPRPAARDSALLQTGQSLASGRAVRSYGVTSDCASRLNMWDQRNAACLVVQDSKAMLVWVYYGSPGWDFPGGRLHEGEAACETAERETCEETGHQVRVLEQLSYNVFRCEVVAYGVCKKAVDEGFLEQKWWGASDLDTLQLRPNTWGDKRGLMRTHLPESSSQPDVALPDALGVCGCKVCNHDGWSSTFKHCAWGAATSPDEACACLKEQGQELDSCGCKACENYGFSSTSQQCAWGAATSPAEECACLKDQGEEQGGQELLDSCGCKACENYGFSSTSQQCAWGSETSPDEACASLKQQGQELLDSCGCKACEDEGWSTTVGACAHGASTDPHEACECRKISA